MNIDKILPLIELAKSHLRGEMTGEEFHFKFIDLICNVGNEEEADLAMEQLARVLAGAG